MWMSRSIRFAQTETSIQKNATMSKGETQAWLQAGQVISNSTFDLGINPGNILGHGIQYSGRQFVERDDLIILTYFNEAPVEQLPGGDGSIAHSNRRSEITAVGQTEVDIIVSC